MKLLIIKENSILQGISQSNSETFYDDCITDKKDLDKILSLMILESLTQNGIENYAKIKRDILAVYGYQNLFLFRNLDFLRTPPLISHRGDMLHETGCNLI